MKKVKQYSIRIIIMVLILSLTSILLCGCKNEGIKTENIDYGKQKILITGLMKDDFTVTVDDLMKLDSVTEKAEASRFNGDKVSVKATGPTLNTFLAQYGKSQTDFAAVRFTARDKYAIAVPKEILENREIILAYANGSDPLAEKDQPVHVVVPGERAMYWVRMLKEIDFETQAGAAMSKKVVFIDNAIKNLHSYEYKDDNSTEHAVKTIELIQKYAAENEPDNVYLSAGDGLTKNEVADTFLSAYIKYTGTDAPKYLAPHFPEGMQINGVLSINYGDTAFYSLDEGSKTVTLKKTNGINGIALTDILKGIHFTSSQQYIVSDKNGSQTRLKEEQMAEGVFCKQDGVWNFLYGSEENKVVKGVLQVEAAQ